MTLRGVLKQNESLAKYTTWRVGGEAKTLYQPADLEDLQAFMQSLPANEPIYWLGLGSNLLVRDGGFDGTVIYTQGGVNEMRDLSEKSLYAEAGVTCSKVSKHCIKQNWEGGEFFAGIPGTVGGALAMNAGAFGGETWEKVTAVHVINRQGEVIRRTPDAFEVAYRSVVGAFDEWFVAGEFEFEMGDGEAVQQRIKALLAKRAETQPMGLPSCGSVFRNPTGDHAARLIESCGLKGHTIGGAQVSEKHANFIISNKSAKASDIETLAAHVKTTVEQETGVDLIPEFKILGETAHD